MVFRIVGSETALADLHDLVRFIARDDRLRKLIVTLYRIFFEIDDDAMTLSILRIWHGAGGNLERPL